MINTSGIVLSTIRYSDSSVIARIYTLHSGLISCMVRTGKGKSAMSKLVLLQPLSLVEISYLDDARKSMKNLRSIERETVLNGIPFDTVKTCIALFMAEIIGRSIAEEEGNASMFRFLQRSVLFLDHADGTINNFHLKFLIDFSKHLGFSPQLRQSSEPYFDLMEGVFVSIEPIHPHYVVGEALERLHELMLTNTETQQAVKMSNDTRRVLLQKLIDLYRLHLPGMKDIRAHKVLEEVLS